MENKEDQKVVEQPVVTEENKDAPKKGSKQDKEAKKKERLEARQKQAAEQKKVKQ